MEIAIGDFQLAFNATAFELEVIPFPLIVHIELL